MRTYRMRSVETGATLSYRVTRFLGLQLRGQYAAGSTSTREAFGVDYLPQFEYLEPPTTQWIRTARLSAGLSVLP